MKYTKDEITHTITGMLDRALDASHNEKDDRVRALRYYDGEVPDLEAEEGRSSAVSKDVRAAMIKIMPSVMRTFFGSDIFAKFTPVAPEDEPGDKQATDYFNRVIMTEGDVETAVHAAIFDGLLLKTGILKAYIDERQDVRIASYSNLDDEQFLALLLEDGVELTEHHEHEETDENVLAIAPDAKRHDCKIRKIMRQNVPKLACVAPEDFLMFPGYDTIEDCPLVGERQTPSRSDLVARGYDRDIVDELASYTIDETDEDDARNEDDFLSISSDLDGVNETVEIYELYVRLDLDDDGIAELHKVVVGGNISDRNIILDIEEFDMAPYADVTPELEAHQFKGHSMFEDTDDIQKIKTALLRSILDNTYDRNNQQPMYDPSAVDDVAALYNREFGKPIKLKPNANAQQAIQYREVPYVGDAAVNMLTYMGAEAEQRTGVTDASAGLDPDALTNTTATVANLIDSKGVAQAEMKIRSMARGGIRKAYKMLLRLAIQHQDRPRTVRIKGEWVNYDPRTWNMEMDCIVNVGMGAGSRERDLQALIMILSQQKEIIAQYGVDSPLLKPIQVYNTLAQIVEAAGLPSAEPYFTEPSDEDIQKAMEAKAAEPSPEDKKLQAQMQMEDKKLQTQAQLEQMKAQAAQSRERAQMDADLQVRQQDQQLDTEARAQELEVKAYHDAERLRFEREKLDAEIAMHQDKLDQQIALASLSARAQQPQYYGQ